MDNWEEDAALYNEDEILNLAENCWMDEGGSAEATRGIKPGSIRLVDVVTPYLVGYLPDNMSAFVHDQKSHISLFNQDLRETSRLVGFGSDRIEIVQRPVFEDGKTLVASDSSCVKIFDLRSGKAEMTIQQRCINSSPMYLNNHNFVCNKLSSGRGAMIWDLRAKKPCYSLPISGNTNATFVPTLSGATNQPPLLLTDAGGYYMFGRDEEDDEWKIRSAARAWEKLEDQRSSDRGDSECTIM